MPKQMLNKTVPLKRSTGLTSLFRHTGKKKIFVSILVTEALENLRHGTPARITVMNKMVPESV